MSTAESPVNECDSCGATGVATDSVRRIYFDPEAPDDPARATATADPERWCASCVANYPHLPADG